MPEDSNAFLIIVLLIILAFVAVLCLNMAPAVNAYMGAVAGAQDQCFHTARSLTIK